MTSKRSNNFAVQSTQKHSVYIFSVLPSVREDLTRYCYEYMDIQQVTYKTGILQSVSTAVGEGS